MVSSLTSPGGGTGAGAVVLEAKEGSGQAGRRKYRRTNFNNIGNEGYHPPSGWYGSVVAEVSKDLTFG